MAVSAFIPVVVVALLGTLCSGKNITLNACYFVGSLEIHSNPAGLPVTSTQCDLIYDRLEFQLQPNVKYLSAKPGELYTLVMVDPDAPMDPPGEYVLQWMQTNIPGEDFRCGNLKNSTEAAPYMGPQPPPGTGLHRYMFFVYRHYPCRKRQVLTLEQFNILFFDLRKYLEESARQGLLLVGPVVGVQFRSEFL